MIAEPLYVMYISKHNADGGEVLQNFPSESMPCVVSSYTNERKRMGGAPTISATIYYNYPLDAKWTREEFIELDGDRYYVSYIPSSSKDNTTGLYKHEISFTSRRELLDNTLFFDVVSDKDTAQDADRYRSNQTKFSFGGTIYEFVSRINSSLEYCGIYRPKEVRHGYHVVIDDGYGTDEIKEVSFEDQYITSVLQLINTTYNLEYYWVGNVCHVGKVQYDLSTSGNYADKYVIRYGSEDALLSVSKENANYKIVDMITGHGSSDNIPYYYPNEDEYGTAEYHVENFDKSLISGIELGKVWKWNADIYNDPLTIGASIGSSYTANVLGNTPVIPIIGYGFDYNSYSHYPENYPKYSPTIDGLTFRTHFGKLEKYTYAGATWEPRCYAAAVSYIFEIPKPVLGATINFTNFVFRAKEVEKKLGILFKYDYKIYVGEGKTKEEVRNILNKASVQGILVGDTEDLVSYSSEYTVLTEQNISILIYCYIDTRNYDKLYHNTAAGLSEIEISPVGSILYNITPKESNGALISDNGKICKLDESGIGITDLNSVPKILYDYEYKDGIWVRKYEKDENVGRIFITGRKFILPASNLMPTIYRNSGGTERFYYAKNKTHLLPGESGKYYEFSNQYKEGNPHQGSVSFDDIKPTINGIRNDVIQGDGLGQLFGEIADVAFDSNDSDIKNNKEEYIHSYFYIKLHKFSGDFGFDLFAHALANESAKINLTKSNGCPACTFTIGRYWDKDKNKCYNNVLTDGQGNLKAYNSNDNASGYKGDYILPDAIVEANASCNQDTTKEEIWICVQKDTSTLGQIMPNASSDFKPEKGDLFVITGINPPKVLTAAAESRLDEALIKYMSENNEDRFNYSIKFSRIYLQQNPEFVAMLNENTKLTIEYDDKKHDVFVSNYTRKVDENILSSIEVGLVNSLEATQSELKQMIDSVKGEAVSFMSGLIGNANSFNANIAGKLFLSKLNDDTAQNIITFLKRQIFRNGFIVGADSTPYGISGDGNATLGTLTTDRVHDASSTDADRVLTGAQGYDIYMGSDGKSYGYIDNLIVRQKALFASMEIRNVSYAGGTVLYSNAGSTIVKVAYVFDTAGKVTAVKCYAKADDGTTRTMNWWRVGMMALCQTYNIGDNGNRYYWRLVISTGQETLDDGMAYDYVVLSNVKTFKGSDAVIPAYGESLLGDKDGNVFGWGDGNVAISITTGDANTTMAASSGADKDNAGTAISDKTFYGYDPGVGNDLPEVGDVIVQAGDQIRWKSRGNMVAVRTSSEDEGADNVPSITMYHSMGAPYSTGSKDAEGNDIPNPYQWKRKTSVQSPEQWLVNANNFKFFTDDDESKVVDPIATTYEIISSSETLTVHADNSTTPTDFTLSLVRHYGNSTAEVTDAKIYAVEHVDDGTEDAYFEYGSVLWPFFPGTMYAASRITFVAYDKDGKDGGKLLASKNIPILRDGTDGKSVSIKGTLSAKEDLPTSGAVSGDGYIINGDLWSYTGTAKEDDSNHNGFTNVGKIQGPSGKDATQYYIYTAWMNTADNSDGSFTTSNPKGAAYKYLGTCISTEKIQPSTWGSYKWSLIKGEDGSSVTMNGKVTDAFTDGILPDGTNAYSWEDVVASGLVSAKAGDIFLFWLSDGAGSRAQIVTYETDSRYNVKDAPVGANYIVDNTSSIMGVDGHLYSCHGDSVYSEWRDMGLWRGRDGVVITATPGNIVFNTGTDGLVDMTKQSTKEVRLSARRGSEELSLSIASVTGHGCEAKISDNSVVFASIGTEEVTLSDGIKKKLSVGGGYVLVSCVVDGVTYNTNVGFSVNVAAYTSQVEWDAQQYNSTFAKYKTEIDGRVDKAESNISQNADEIKLRVSKNDLESAGIYIDAEKITLQASRTYVKNDKGENIAVFNSDGSVVAGSLKTADTGYGSVEVKNGEIGIYNPNGGRNIRFGLSGDGYMVLQYFDNDGNLLYDLGPSGLTQSSVTGKSWFEGEYVNLVSGTDYERMCLWSDGTWKDTAPTGGSLYGTWYTKATGSLTDAAFADITNVMGQTKPPTGTQPRWDDNGYTSVKLYKYYAAKINGTALADTDAGLTATEAAKADGRWFTQKTDLGDGSGDVRHTASGDFIPYEGKVAKFVPDRNGFYPTYKLQGMMSIGMGFQLAALTDIVSEAVTENKEMSTNR